MKGRGLIDRLTLLRPGATGLALAKTFPHMAPAPAVSPSHIPCRYGEDNERPRHDDTFARPPPRARPPAAPGGAWHPTDYTRRDKSRGQRQPFDGAPLRATTPPRNYADFQSPARAQPARHTDKQSHPSRICPHACPRPRTPSAHAPLPNDAERQCCSHARVQASRPRRLQWHTHAHASYSSVYAPAQAHAFSQRGRSKRACIEPARGI